MNKSTIRLFFCFWGARSITNPPASHNRQSLSCSCKANTSPQQFYESAIGQHLLDNAQCALYCSNKKFSILAWGCSSTFLLLKRLSLNLSISFCLSKKNSLTVWKFLNLFSHWITSFSQWELCFPLHNSVRFQFCFILKISLISVRWKALGKKIFYFNQSSNSIPPNVYLKEFIKILTEKLRG